MHTYLFYLWVGGIVMIEASTSTQPFMEVTNNVIFILNKICLQNIFAWFYLPWKPHFFHVCWCLLFLPEQRPLRNAPPPLPSAFSHIFRSWDSSGFWEIAHPHLNYVDISQGYRAALLRGISPQKVKSLIPRWLLFVAKSFVTSHLGLLEPSNWDIRVSEPNLGNSWANWDILVIW